MLAHGAKHVLHHTGVGLVACHGRCAVVQNDKNNVVLVENGVGKAGHAGMEERGIADKGHHGLARSAGKAAARRNRRPHAHQKVRTAQGRQQTKGVTADVAGIEGIVAKNLPGGIVNGAVRTTGAKVRRAARQLKIDTAHGFGRAGRIEPRRNAAHDEGGGVFALAGEARILALDTHVDVLLLHQRADVLFQKVNAFFQHQHAVAAAQKFGDHVGGQGPGHTQLKHAHAVFPAASRKGIGQIVAGHAAGDDAKARGGLRFAHGVEPAGFRKLAGLFHDAVKGHMALAGNGGHRHKTAWVALEFNLGLGRGQIVKIHRAAQVADAGGGAQHYRLLQLAGKAKSLAGHVLGFLSRHRLKTGQQGKARVGAVVLFVLA